MEEEEEEEVLPREEEEVLESSAQTAASICVTSPLKGQKSEEAEGSMAETTAALGDLTCSRTSR